MYEYRLVQIANDNPRPHPRLLTNTLEQAQVQMNELGAEGWELFSTQPTVVIFRRALP